MDKEKVTEELVRQNGNQAAAVMADYAGQGGEGGSIKLYKSTILSVDNMACVYDFFTPKAGDIMFFGFRPEGSGDNDPAWVYPFIIKEFDEESGTGTAMAFTAYANGSTVSRQDSTLVLGYLHIEDPTNIPINPSGRIDGIAISPSPDMTELAVFWREFKAQPY